MKKITVLILAAAIALLMLSGATPADAELPQKHKIEIAGAVDGLIEGASSVDDQIDIAGSPYFTAPDFYNGGISETLVLLENFETYQQTSERSCGAACMLMIVRYLDGTILSEDALDKEMDIRYYDNPREDGSYGASTSALAKAFTERGYEIVTSLETADDNGISFDSDEKFAEYIKDQLTAGAPTMVESVEWGGHWMVIIGYDDMGTENLLDDVLVFADPYDTCDHYQDGYYTKNFEKYYCEWFDAGVMSADESTQQYITVLP